MALDGMFLHLLTLEVGQKVLGAKVDKIHQPTKNELVFILRTRSGMFKLLLSADGNAPRFCLTENAPENPPDPPMLCMLLRKRLIGATLTAIEQQGLDRVAFFRFDAVNEIGDKVRLSLAVEIMAQYSNIILLEESGRIVDAVRRVNSEKSSFRLVLPGAQYQLPPPQNKLNLLLCDGENAAGAICTMQNASLSSAILKTLFGVSPLLSREIAYRVCYDDKAVSALSAEEKGRLKTVLDDLRERLQSGNAEPSLALDAASMPTEFSFVPIREYGDTLKNVPQESLSALLDAFYGERDRISRSRSRAFELFKQLDNATQRVARKLDLQRAELLKCGDRDELRLRAELITACSFKLQKGKSVYEVDNYYDGTVLSVKADPALSPGENAQKLYKEYRKACTAETMLKKLIVEGEEDLRFLESEKDLLERASLEKEFSAIKNELIAEGFLKRKSKPGKKEPKASSLPVLRFETSQGFQVLVGRSNVQNDLLTFKTAKKGDIWLHAQKTPGSHTILQKDGREIPDEAIVEAASIAAYYSSARSAGTVTVDYSDVKNIKKPNGAKPGFVVYYTYYSVNVPPKDGNT